MDRSVLRLLLLLAILFDQVAIGASQLSRTVTIQGKSRKRASIIAGDYVDPNRTQEERVNECNKKKEIEDAFTSESVNFPLYSLGGAFAITITVGMQEVENMDMEDFRLSTVVRFAIPYIENPYNFPEFYSCSSRFLYDYYRARPYFGTFYYNMNFNPGSFYVEDEVIFASGTTHSGKNLWFTKEQYGRGNPAWNFKGMRVWFMFDGWSYSFSGFSIPKQDVRIHGQPASNADLSAVPCECGYEAVVTLHNGIPFLVCKNIDECKEKGACTQEFKKTKCVDLPGSFECVCESGYVQDESSLRCIPEAFPIQQTDTDYRSFKVKYVGLDFHSEVASFRIEASRVNPFDENIREEIGRLSLRSKKVSVQEIKNGVQYSDLSPGTTLELQIIAIFSDDSEVAQNNSGFQKFSTSCRCPGSVSEAPTLFNVKQRNGFIEFDFVDNSACADTFMFTRFLLDNKKHKASKGTPLASTYSIFKQGVKNCGQTSISPQLEAADDLKKTKLTVGETYRYEVTITSSVTAQTYTLPVHADHEIQWEASIQGQVTTNPEYGAHPVENVFIKCILVAPNVTIETVTDEAGKYTCRFRDRDDENYGFAFTNNGEYSVDITFSKYSNSSYGKIQHEFYCRGGVQQCTDEPLRVNLKHLELNKPVHTFDETAVPINGRVTVANTLGCPLAEVKVCLTEYHHKSFRDTSICTETDSLGQYTLLASIDAIIGLRVFYSEHEMLPTGNTQWTKKGVKIIDGIDYEGFDFEDVQLSNLTIEVGGGVCKIDLGKTTLDLKLQGCASYSKQLRNVGFRNAFEVPAHAMQLEITDIRTYNDEKRTRILDYFEGKQRFVDLTDLSREDEGRKAVFEYEGVAKISPKFYKVGAKQLLKKAQPPVDDCKSGDLPYDALQEVKDDQSKSYSFHLLDDKTYYLLSADIKMFIADDLPLCDRVVEGTNFTIRNELGYSDGTKESDIEALENDLKEKMVARNVINVLGRCNNGCSLPVLTAHQSKLPATDQLANAQVELDFLTGYPNFFEPYTRILTISTIGLYYPVQHVCEVVIEGTRVFENFGSFALPQTEPIMVLRDPPGSDSYAYYKNVETKIELVSKHHDRSRKWNVDFMPGYYGTFSDFSGVGWMGKNSEATIDTKIIYKTEESTMEEYNDDIYSGKLTATWSYETSKEVWTAGRSSDVFVIPSLNVVFNKNRRVKWNVNTCRADAITQTEFDLENGGANRELFSFVSHYFITREEIPRLKKLIAEKVAMNDTMTGISDELQEEINSLQNSLDSWKKIIESHDNVTLAAKERDMNQLLGASNYVDEKVVEELPDQVGKYFRKYSRPFAPKTLPYSPKPLRSNIDDANLDDRHSFKFDGGGSSFKYELSHEALTSTSSRHGEDADNRDSSSAAGFSTSNRLSLGGPISVAIGKAISKGVMKTAFAASLSAGYLAGVTVAENAIRRGLETETNERELNRHRELFQVNLEFTHSLNIEHNLKVKKESTSTESTTGFVLGDEDSGDFFDVDVFIDKKYGSFVFHTISGESKCPVEAGTTPREVPFMAIKEFPNGPVLPDEDMMFKVFLQNQGIDLTSLEVYQDLRTNTDGLQVSVNSQALTIPTQIEKILGGEGYEALLTVSRGPKLYEYPPVTLLFRSTCEYTRNIGDGNLIALSDGESAMMKINVSNALDSEGNPVIKFERPCPEIVWSGSIEAVRSAGNEFILNVDTYNDVFEIIIRNPNRNLNKLADVNRLEEIKVWYRRLGVGEWTRALDPEENLIDMKTLDEDEFGYIQANWNIKALFDGQYEVYVECNCEKFFGSPDAFGKAKTKSLMIIQDTKRPQLYGIPMPFEVITPNTPVIFEFTEPIQCLEPYTFQVRVIIDGNDAFYDENNLVVLCEDRSVRVSFENTFRWENVMGESLIVTIQDVLDLNGNSLEETLSHQIRFPSPESDSVIVQFNLRIRLDCFEMKENVNSTKEIANEISNLLQLDSRRVSIIGVQCEREGLLVAKVKILPATDIADDDQERRILSGHDDPKFLIDQLVKGFGGDSNATVDNIVITTETSATQGESSIVYTPESPAMSTLDSLKTKLESVDTNTQTSFEALKLEMKRNDAAMGRLEAILIGLSVTLVSVIFGGLVIVVKMRRHFQDQTIGVINKNPVFST